MKFENPTSGMRKKSELRTVVSPTRRVRSDFRVHLDFGF